MEEFPIKVLFMNTTGRVVIEQNDQQLWLTDKQAEVLAKQIQGHDWTK